jgi:hypothetical protein
VRALEDKFYGIELNHVPQRYNEEADELAKIASGQITVPPNVFARDIAQPSVSLELHPSNHAEPSGAPSNPAGAEPMDEDPSNEAYVLSLLKGYGAGEAEVMDVEPAPSRADWCDVGGIRNRAFAYPKNRERLCEGCWQQNPQKQQVPFSFSGRNFLSGTLRRYQSHQHESNLTQGVKVSLGGPFHDETPGANTIHPESLGLGFEQGVSSLLTFNKFKLECEFCFR